MARKKYSLLVLNIQTSTDEMKHGSTRRVDRLENDMAERTAAR